MTKLRGPLDMTDRIISYEMGELDDAGVIHLFQDLLDSGGWQHLQGHYQRTMIAFLRAGLVTREIRPDVPTRDEEHELLRDIE